MTKGLAITDVSHRYGQHRVIDSASLTIERGEIACLLGPSGCGKTTLLRIAAGLEALQSGRVSIGDRTVAEAGNMDLPPEQRSVGLMFQDYALFPHLSVAENVAFGLTRTQSDARRRVDERLSLMGLDGYRDRYPHELSGGQQQRVALLRAIAPQPAVLLLDEPFTGLDTSLRSQVRDQTLELLAVERQTAMMVTHDPEEAMYMADRLFIMNEGAIVQSGSPVEVYARPVNAFVAGLFGPLNRLAAVVDADGNASTPLGRFSANGLASGTQTEVLIRPEHVTLGRRGEIEASHTMTVVWCRSIGRSTHVHLASDNTDGLTLTARIPGAFSGEQGDRVAVVATDALVFAL